jgi:chromosome segregation ATPase
MLIATLTNRIQALEIAQHAGTKSNNINNAIIVRIFIDQAACIEILETAYVKQQAKMAQVDVIHKDHSDLLDSNLTRLRTLEDALEVQKEHETKIKDLRTEIKDRPDHLDQRCNNLSRAVYSLQEQCDSTQEDLDRLSQVVPRYHDDY